MSIINYNKDLGLSIATKQEVIDELKKITTDAFGEDIILDDTYPEGVLINGVATMLNDILQQTQSIYNMLDITNAEGVALDTLGNIRNTYRKTTSKASLSVSFTGSYTFTTAEEITLKDDNNIYYTSNDPVSILEGTMEFTCSTEGSVSEPKTLTIINNVEGVSVGYFKFTDGSDVEQDIFFRNRIISSSAYNALSVKENLITNLLLLSESVDQVKLYVNDTDASISTKFAENIIPTAHILVLIKLTEDSKSTDENIFKTIQDYKGIGTVCTKFSAGSGYEGTISGEGDYSNITYYKVPTIELSKIQISIGKGDQYTSETEGKIKENIVSYIKGLGIGENIYSGNVIKYLYKTSNSEYYVQKVIIGEGTDDKYVNPDAHLEVSSDNIKITVVEE